MRRHGWLAWAGAAVWAPLARFVERRRLRELADWRGARGVSPAAAPRRPGQTFRAFIQVNLLPRAR